MNRLTSFILICAVLIAMAPSVQADFLVLRIGETTAENIRHLIIACVAVVVILTLKSSRSKGGEGR